MKKDEVASLVRYRLEQAESALADANFLFQNNRSFNSVINRAYYAMFYASIALLQEMGKVPSKHTGVISLFDTEFVLKGIFTKEMSKAFHKAFELRHVSDYRAIQPISRDMVTSLLSDSANFVTQIKKYLKNKEIKGARSFKV